MPDPSTQPPVGLTAPQKKLLDAFHAALKTYDRTLWPRIRLKVPAKDLATLLYDVLAYIPPEGPDLTTPASFIKAVQDGHFGTDVTVIDLPEGALERYLRDFKGKP